MSTATKSNLETACRATTKADIHGCMQFGMLVDKRVSALIACVTTLESALGTSTPAVMALAVLASCF